MPSLALEVKPFPVAELVPYYMNAKEHDLESIMESLAGLGQYRPVVVNVGTRTGRTNEVLVGNGTVEAAGKLGWNMIDCQFVDVDEENARKINLNANAVQDRAGYVKDILLESLGLLDDLVASGYTEADVAKMLTPYDSTAGLDAGSQMGELEYRLIVDCQGEDHQRRLMEQLEGEGLTVRALIA